MIINQQESWIGRYTDEKEHPHYYISSTNLVSDSKNEYLRYVNCIDYDYGIDYLVYWIEKE